MSLKLLLVEDDPIQANETKAKLLKAGYDVLLATEGINAIKLVKTEKPDIILLDVVLPGIDGHEVCRWLKLEESTKGIPVIMLTANETMEDVFKLEGVKDYFVKPVDIPKLLAKIKEVLGENTL